MDSLDVKVYREFFHGRTGLPLDDIRRSYNSTARKLAIDEVTFRNRIKSFQQSGFVKGWALFVNPCLLGARVAQFWLTNVRPASDKDDLIRKLSLIRGVLAISDYYGSSLTVIIMYEDEFSARKEFELIAKMSNAENSTRASIPFPQCSIELKQTDWRIIQAIQTNPRQSYPIISRAVGISSKTVKRRLQRMIEEKALFAIPSFNPKALQGGIIADLVVFYASPGLKTDVDHKIMSRFENFLMRAEVGDPAHGFFNFLIWNIFEAKKIVTWVKEQPGVGSAFMELVQDRIEVYDSFREPINKKVAGILTSSS